MVNLTSGVRKMAPDAATKRRARSSGCGGRDVDVDGNCRRADADGTGKRLKRAPPSTTADNSSSAGRTGNQANSTEVKTEMDGDEQILQMIHPRSRKREKPLR